MQFFALVALFAAAATASPTSYGSDADPTSSITVAQANSYCNTGNTIACCDKTETNIGSPNHNGGLLNGALEGGALSGCVPLDLNIIAVANGLLNSQCKNSAACCDSNRIEQNGLINVGCLPVDLPI